MVSGRIIDGLRKELGELLERHEKARDLSEFSRYESDPNGFDRDELGGESCEHQIEIADAVLDHPLVTVRSCHAAGKDYLAARLALWWVYARQGLVILTGPTAAQVEEILMRREVRNAFLAGNLPGELHVRALRPSGGSGAAGILARTASGIHGMTGLHEARVLFIITEAQDPDLAHAWDAAFAVCTGKEDRILTLGNPTEPHGKFYNAHQPNSGWHAIKVAAADIPNVREGRTVVPGLLSREGVERFRREYGEKSGFYQSRINADFPEMSVEGLFNRSMLDAAVDRKSYTDLEEEEPVVAIDPARMGPDKSVLVAAQGGTVTAIRSWSKMETMELTGRIDRELKMLGVKPFLYDKHGNRRAHGRVVVDEVGLGAGVLDRLRELGYDCVGFNGGRSASERRRFMNVRAEAYWTLRERLEAGEITLPASEPLLEELLATQWRPNSSGQITIESKDDLRSRLGRSPDYADAVSMAFYVPLIGGVAPKARKLKRTWA